VLAHGLLKGALFLAAGIVLNELGDVDELRLHGQGRRLPVAAVAFALGAVGLAGFPLLGGFGGHSLVEQGASGAGYPWIGAVLALASIVTSAAILRSGARIFLGLGPDEDRLLSPEPPERPPADPARSAGPLMRGAMLALLVLGLAISLVPGLERRAEQAASRFEDRQAYVAAVLRGETAAREPPVAFRLESPPLASVVYGLVAVLGAFGLAALALGRERLSARLRRSLERATGPPVALLRAVHSGVVTDYVAWTTFGAAALGGLLALLLR
jgi:multicomponent Na+:H+ antiporter subunit D